MADLQSTGKDQYHKKSWHEHEFEPHPLLKNQHLMTIVPGFLPRKNLTSFRRSGKSKLFQINNEAKLLGYLHLHKDQQSKKAPTVIVLHGLEGSSESSHVQGIGFKAFHNGFNVLRLNMRNCGGSMQHSETLYNAGMWQDVQNVMKILKDELELQEFILAGYSLGGNLLLNTTANHDADALGFRINAVCAVSPAVDLAHSVTAIERPENRIYQDWFLRTLKQKIIAKTKQAPSIYNPGDFHDQRLKSILTIREFDDQITAPFGGYGTAEKYYREASSRRHLKNLKVPTLIITAEDDPLVPVDSFAEIQEMKNSSSHIKLLITKHGGHGGFFQTQSETESYFDQYWAENRVVAFMREVSRT